MLKKFRSALFNIPDTTGIALSLQRIFYHL
jgi:hypothetical protein